MTLVDLSKPTPTSTPNNTHPIYTERAELVLGLPDIRALALPALQPDPLQHLAQALAGIRSETGETADVCLDLIPVSERRLARRRRTLLATARRRGPSAYGERLDTTGADSAAGLGLGIIEALAADWKGNRTTTRGTKRLPRMTDVRDNVGKFTPGTGVFAVQLLLRTTAAHPQIAAARMHQLLAALAATSGENYLRPRRPKSRRAIAHFDHRIETGAFAPRRRQWLTVPELASFLKPPTMHCAGSNLVRSGGIVPPAPATLPIYTGQPDLVPLGAVTFPDGRERIGAARTKDLLFGLQLGKSGHGKTEAGLVQAIALAHNGHGVWYLDPHGEAWARAKPYLAHPHLQDRVWEIDLATPTLDQHVVSWNPLAMEGRDVTHVQDAVRAVTEGIAAAQEWGDKAPRARTILARTSQALALLALKAIDAGRPDLQPTLFQIRTWLTDDDWRDALLPQLPPTVQKYWSTTFPKLAENAVPTVTYAIDRIDTSMSLQAFFGSPRSGYDVRTAMDTGRIVFICPSGSESDSLVACLLIRDLYRAGLSRQDTHRDDRRTFWAWGDELTALDASSKGFLAAIAEQLRKYEVRFSGMTQMALRLSPITRQALLQNQSLLSTCAADYDEAAFVARRWNGHVAVEAITELPKYHQVMSIALDGRPTKPFRVRGLPVEEIYADYHNPEGLPALDQAIDTNIHRRPVTEILDALETLDDDIRTLFTNHPTPPATTAHDSTGSDPDDQHTHLG
ncbi:ATP/GTP-binding protein [Streptomyces sp. NPDC004296]|uniref:ATP/GTP-binding protein n=1 Tax=Streptomyces sp. NPDC004296 TaxID=3364697 RepID=UPI0036A0E6F8